MKKTLYFLLVLLTTGLMADDKNRNSNSGTIEKIDSKDHKKPEESETQKAIKKEHEEDEELILIPNPKWKDSQPTLHRTPPNSTKGVNGLGIDYTMWFNPREWEESAPLNEHAERSFKSIDENSYAIIVTDKKRFSLDDLDDIVIKNAKENGFERATIISNEKRIVNGQHVLFIHWTALLQGLHVDFLTYVYSSKEGSVFIHTYTPSALFKRNSHEMETFLNGFTLKNAKNEKDTEQ